MPYEILKTSEPHAHISKHDYVAKIQNAMATAYDKLKIIHQRLRAKMKADYDKRRLEMEFKIGSKVLIYFPPQAPHSKLHYLWRGPWEVHDKCNNGLNYKLKDLVTGEILPEWYNVNRLARYHSRHDKLLKQNAASPLNEEGGSAGTSENRNETKAEATDPSLSAPREQNSTFTNSAPEAADKDRTGPPNNNSAQPGSQAAAEAKDDEPEHQIEPPLNADTDTETLPQRADSEDSHSDDERTAPVAPTEASPLQESSDSDSSDEGEQDTDDMGTQRGDSNPGPTHDLACPFKDIKPGDMLIVKLDPSEYDGLQTGEDRIQRKGRKPRGGGLRKGAAMESPHLAWRLVEVIETQRATPTAEATLAVVFWETYDHRLDITKRQYAKAYIAVNGPHKELYSNSYRYATASNWQQMATTVAHSQVMTPPFRLTAKSCIPGHICQQLLPHLAALVTLIPATVTMESTSDTRGGWKRRLEA